MQLRAPAKINLSFRILHRRTDDFHEIETLMAPISLHDELTIERNEKFPGIQFRCDDSSLPIGQENLVVRAATLFFETAKQRPAVEIALTKKIPHAAGLGGGSSDAASTLLGLNQLYATRWPREKLSELAARIGADVPFFIYESAAICRGRGEIVTPTKLEGKFSLLLVKPGFNVATRWAYSRWQRSLELLGISYALQEFAGVNFANDLERPVFEKFVFLSQLKMWLLKQPEVGVALLSGSGSTVFALLHDGAAPESLANRARAEFDPELWICPCSTLG